MGEVREEGGKRKKKKGGEGGNREEEGGEARRGFRVALTQDISLSDSRDRRGARLCLL